MAAKLCSACWQHLTLRTSREKENVVRENDVKFFNKFMDGLSALKQQQQQ